jgi:hypothetical protein
MVHRPEGEIAPLATDRKEWAAQRAQERGIPLV